MPKINLDDQIEIFRFITFIFFLISLFAIIFLIFE